MADEIHRLILHVQGQADVENLRAAIQGEETAILSATNAIRQLQAAGQGMSAQAKQLEADMRTSAASIISAHREIRKLQGSMGSMGGAGGRFGMAMTQASYAIGDFASASGDLGQKLNAVANNVQFAAAQFGPWGQAVSIATVAGISFYRNYDEITRLFKEKRPFLDGEHDVKLMKDELAKAQKEMQNLERYTSLTIDEVGRFNTLREKTADLEKKIGDEMERQKQIKQFGELKDVPADEEEKERAASLKDSLGGRQDMFVSNLADAMSEKARRRIAELTERSKTETDRKTLKSYEEEIKGLQPGAQDPSHYAKTAREMAARVSATGNVQDTRYILDLMQATPQSFDDHFRAAFENVSPEQMKFDNQFDQDLEIRQDRVSERDRNRKKANKDAYEAHQKEAIAYNREHPNGPPMKVWRDHKKGTSGTFIDEAGWHQNEHGSMVQDTADTPAHLRNQGTTIVPGVESGKDVWTPSAPETAIVPGAGLVPEAPVFAAPPMPSAPAPGRAGSRRPTAGPGAESGAPIAHPAPAFGYGMPVVGSFPVAAMPHAPSRRAAPHPDAGFPGFAGAPMPMPMPMPAMGMGFGPGMPMPVPPPPRRKLTPKERIALHKKRLEARKAAKESRKALRRLNRHIEQNPGERMMGPGHEPFKPRSAGRGRALVLSPTNETEAEQRRQHAEQVSETVRQHTEAQDAVNTERAKRQKAMIDAERQKDTDRRTEAKRRLDDAKRQDADRLAAERDRRKNLMAGGALPAPAVAAGGGAARARAFSGQPIDLANTYRLSQWAKENADAHERAGNERVRVADARENIRQHHQRMMSGSLSPLPRAQQPAATVQVAQGAAQAAAQGVKTTDTVLEATRNVTAAVARLQADQQRQDAQAKALLSASRQLLKPLPR